MSNTEIERFADSCRSDPKKMSIISEMSGVDAVCSFASELGYNIPHADMDHFLKGVINRAPEDGKKDLPRNTIHFDESQILRFAAVRLQVDTDY